MHEVGLLDDIKKEAERFDDTGLSPVGAKEARPLGLLEGRAKSLFAVNGASGVVGENGEPLVVWHGSNWNPLAEKSGMAVFRTGEGETDSGAHFGTKQAAKERGGRNKNWNLTPVYLNIRNPIEVNDTGYWTPGDMVAEIRKTKTDFP